MKTVYKDSPCYGCKDRMLGCHAICRAYKDWREQNQEVNRKIVAEKELKRTVGRESRRKRFCGKG